MKTSIVGIASLLSAFVFVTPAAAADSVGVVAVAEPPGPTPALAELTHQLRLVAAERTAGVVDANELRVRMTGQTSSATLAELDRAYGGALATYQNGDFDGSVRTLRAVVQDLERLPPSAEAFSQWTRAMVRLGRAEQTLGRGVDAREVLERLVRANPAVKVDPNQYPPSFVRQVEEVKARVAKLAKRKLTVTATTKGAKIFVEGREVGMAPITLDLPPGRYRVSGVRGSLHAPAVVADLNEEGQSINLNFALAEALRPGFGPGLALGEAGRARNLVAAGNWLGVDKLLATSLVTEAGVDYLVATSYDVRHGMLLREGRIRLPNQVAPAGAMTALVTFLITGQPSTLVAQTQVGPAPADGASKAGKKASLEARPPQEAQSDVDFKTPAQATGPSNTKGWIAFGAGVTSAALAGFAIYEGMAARSKYGKADGLVQSDGALEMTASVTQYKQYVQDGDSAKTAAYVSAGGAVGCAVVSGVLGYLSYKQTGEIGPFRF